MSFVLQVRQRVLVHDVDLAQLGHFMSAQSPRIFPPNTMMNSD
ncbi:MAG: hypothetical protein ACREBG_12475 [Pyrinomonadaceae bacterium]